MKKVILMLTVVLSFGFLSSCVNSLADLSLSEEKVKSVEETKILIGDEIIYGNSFSFQDLYDSGFEEVRSAVRSVSARSAVEVSDDEFYEDDFLKMVYFSVKPSTIESMQKINEVMGYLNPVELDKEILQACDAESIIFNKDIEIYKDMDLSETVNFETKYYYIVSKENALTLGNELENFEVIEEFEVLTDEAVERIYEEYLDYLKTCEENSRGVFSNIFNGIKKAAQSVKSFFADEYDVSGTLYYKITDIQVPAYGINVANVCIGGCDGNTNTNGKFSVGKRRNAAGLCTLKLNYENEACTLSNFLNITAATVVRTDWPSKLVNVTITSDSDYANYKMAICSDTLRRYDDESKRHKGIPAAKIWTTEIGSGTSSAPCFNYMGAAAFPDIVITGATASRVSMLRTFHHEYSHFLHCVYTGNKDNFWLNVVASEIGCTLSTGVVNLINIILETDLSNGYVAGFYNFKNPYVCFTENFAEWYSFVGCYGQGDVGKEIDKRKNEQNGCGSKTGQNYFDNQEVFSELVKILYDSIGEGNEEYIRKTDTAYKFIDLIDNKNIVTFNEFYKAVVEEYPDYKQDIDSVFIDYYKRHGTEEGNVTVVVYHDPEFIK